jgi:hypothetical protein
VEVELLSAYGERRGASGAVPVRTKRSAATATATAATACRAVSHVNGEIRGAVIRTDASDQRRLEPI